MAFKRPQLVQSSKIVVPHCVLLDNEIGHVRQSKRVTTTCERRATYGIVVTLLFVYGYKYIYMCVCMGVSKL